MINHSSSGATPRQVALEIIHRLNAKYDLRLDDVLNNHALSVTQKHRMMVRQLLEATFTSLDEHDRDAGIVRAVTESDRKIVAALDAGDDVELEPNFALTEHNARIIRDYQGQELYDYVYSLTKRFENMANAKTEGQLAIEIVSGSLVSIGVAMAVGAVKAWRAGATLLAAVRTGVLSVGMKTAIAVVVFILVALLLYLFLDNPKKILGMLINDSDENFVVKDWRKGVDGGSDSDLYMAHGSMKSFPEDHENENLDSPLVQLRQRFYFGPNDPENVVCASVYFADRGFGLRGSEGVMLLASKTTPTVVAHMFAVPYVNDNGTNMRLVGGRPPLPELYRDLYDTRRVRVDVTGGGYRLTSTVNSARGGVVALVGFIEQL